MGKFTEDFRAFLANLPKVVNKGKTPYIITFAALVISTLLVYLSPRSVPAFLLFLLSAGSIYALKTNNRFKLIIGLVVALLILPVIGARNIFYLEVIFQISLFSALALGLNIVVGFTGLLNLGYVAFYAIGAYLWAFFGSRQPFLLDAIPGTAPPNTPFFLDGNFFYLFILLGVVVVALAGLLLGLPVLRVRGDYLAIVTLGFGEVIRVMANNLDKPLNLTNGPQGITPIQRPSLSPALLEFLNTLLTPLVGTRVTEAQFYNIFFYFIALMVCAVVILVTIRLDDSKVGRAWTAIREDELAAVAMGIPAVRLKLLAFAVGASFAGAMGVLLAASRTFVSPESFNFMQSIGVLTMVILGGIGSIPGVILGAAVVTVLNLQVLQGLSLWLSSLRQSDSVIPIINFAWKDLSNQLDPAKYQRLLFGLVLILMMIYRPAGLIPAERRKRELVKEENLAAPPADIQGAQNG
jgi:branched-chain amino acid transport system permease protein